MVELRRYQRAKLDVDVEIVAKGSAERLRAHAKDIAIGGMFVEIERPLDHNTEIVVHLRLPRQAGELALPGRVRWTRAGGMGIQFGLLGARETYAITECTKLT